MLPLLLASMPNHMSKWEWQAARYPFVSSKTSDPHTYMQESEFRILLSQS